MTLERTVAAVVALVLGAGAWFVVRLARRRLGAPIEPVGIFLFAWAVSLALFAIPLVRYTHSSLEAWLAIYGAILMFVAGAGAAYRFVHVSPMRPVSFGADVKDGRLRLLVVVALVLTWIGFAGFVHAVDGVIGWQKIFTNPHAVQSIESTSVKFQTAYGSWRLLTYFGAIGFLLWTMGIRLHRFGGRFRIFYVLGPLMVVPYLFTTDRVLLVTALIWTGLFHLIWRPVTSFRRLLLPALISAAVLVGLFVALAERRGQTLNAYPDIAASLTTRAFGAATFPYLYVTSDVPVFSRLIDDPNAPRSAGALTFRPVVKVAGVVGIGGPAPPVTTPFYPIPFQAFNTASWLAPLYLDYGFAGCLVFPLVIGFGLAVLSKKVLASQTVVGAWVLSVGMLAAAATPIEEKFSNTLTWELAALGLVLSLALSGEPIRDKFRAANKSIIGALRMKRALAASWTALVIVLAVLVAAAIAYSRSIPPTPTTPRQIAQALRVAEVKAHRVYVRSGTFPSRTTLATQLQMSDPEVRYEPASAPGQPVPGPATVSVFTTPTTATFAAGEPDGSVMLLRQDESGPRPRTYGPVSLRPSGLLRDGNFRPPAPAWNVVRGKPAGAVIETFGGPDGGAAVRVTGRGRTGRATVVEQTVPDLVGRLPSGPLVLRLLYRSLRLSRPLAVEIRLSYQAGRYQFFSGRTSTTAAGLGIPAGASNGWRTITLEAHAKSALSNVTVFAVDTGTTKMRGSVWLANASLTIAAS